MSTRLVILGLLKSKPLYGYEIKHIIEDHMGDWTSIAFGSIYFALNKLSQEGFVSQVDEKKVGNRPSRCIYEITEEGKQEFDKILNKLWEKIERDYYNLDIALAFSNELSEKTIEKHLINRINYIEKTLIHLKEHKEEQLNNSQVPKSAKAIFLHSELHFKAEYEWLKETLKLLKSGNLF